jgi:hypothetical protein
MNRTPSLGPIAPSLELRVIAVGDDADQLRWHDALQGAADLVEWRQALAESLVDLRNDRFHLLFIASDMRATMALTLLSNPPPVVLGSGRQWDALQSCLPPYVALAHRDTDLRSLFRDLVASARGHLRG